VPEGRFASLVDSGFFAGCDRVCTVAGEIAGPAVPGQVIGTALARWAKADILVGGGERG
jgi:hypothetical protein